MQISLVIVVAWHRKNLVLLSYVLIMFYNHYTLCSTDHLSDTCFMPVPQDWQNIHLGLSSFCNYSTLCSTHCWWEWHRWSRCVKWCWRQYMLGPEEAEGGVYEMWSHTACGRQMAVVFHHLQEYYPWEALGSIFITLRFLRATWDLLCKAYQEFSLVIRMDIVFGLDTNLMQVIYKIVESCKLLLE